MATFGWQALGVLFLAASGTLASAPPSVAQSAPPTLGEARAFLHQHTDLACDARQNPRLEAADRIVRFSGGEPPRQLVFDLYCDNAGAHPTRAFLLWRAIPGRMSVLLFARPVFDLAYHAGSALADISRPPHAKAFEAVSALENARFDEKTGQIEAHIPYDVPHGTGETGRWRWNHRSERFDLVSYRVSPYAPRDLAPAERPVWAGKSIPLFGEAP